MSICREKHGALRIVVQKEIESMISIWFCFLQISVSFRRKSKFHHSRL